MKTNYKDGEHNGGSEDYCESQKRYDLHKIYGAEKPLERYKRLTVGENARTWDLVWHEIVLGLFTGLPGLLGLAVRNWVYTGLFKGFDRGAYIGKQVTLRCPRQITLAKGVIIDDFVQVIATSKRIDAISVGANTVLRSYAMLNSGPPEGYIHVGKDSSIGQGAILYGNGGLNIGNKVLIAGQCFIVASSHNFDHPNDPIADQGYSASGILIEDNVWIGAGAKILDGVTIGAGAIIGANAVVTRSVAPGDCVVGVPARSMVMPRSEADSQ